MAINFKNSVSHAVGTGITTIYTCPAATQAVIFGMNVTNLLGGACTATVVLVSATYSSTVNIVAPAYSIASGGSLVVAGGVEKIVLMAGDAIKVTSGTSSGLDVSISVMEKS